MLPINCANADAPCFAPTPGLAPMRLRQLSGEGTS